MLKLLTRNWWLVALRGLLAVIFGVLALIWPQITLSALVILFGVYILIDGIFTVISALRDREQYVHWGLLLLEGLAGIAIGVLTFIWPGITALVLLYLIVAWALVTGVLEIIAAFQLRKEIENEWLLGLGGVASLVFGVLALIWPASGALAIVWIIGIYAIIFGVVLIALGFRLRNLHQKAEPEGTVQSAL